MGSKLTGKSVKKDWWKKAVFALGVLIVIGAIVYSVAIRSPGSTAAQPSSKPVSTVAGGAANAPAQQGIADLNWVKSLEARFADHEFVFIVLPGSDSSDTSVKQEIDKAVAKIEANGTNLDTVTLNRDDPELRITAERLAISKLPAVVAIGLSGQGVLIKDGITETKLLNAYLTISKACAPGSTSGCCP
jgi:hypothetical protein